ncbi:MAG: PH domain-containing protein [Candidatus Paceibacterota bacterium]
MILQQGEQVLFEVRKHWFIYVSKVWVLPLLALVFPAVVIGVEVSGVDLPFVVEVHHVALGLFLYFVWLLLLWVIAFILWTDYYLDEWIVTLHRIIDVEQLGLFRRDVASLHFDRIQDVKVVVSGFIATLLDYGDLHIQSAGSEREVVLTGAKRPFAVKKELNHLMKQVADAPQRVVMAETEDGGEGGEKISNKKDRSVTG